MIFEIVPCKSRSNAVVSSPYQPDLEGFKSFMQEHYPHIIGRKILRVSPEENTEEFRNDCWKFHFIVQPVSTFVETTFTAKEMEALKIVVDWAAGNCGGGEDTIGAIMYTGAFRKLKDEDGAVVALARKIDCYGD
jgi:hypothetical protein